MATTRPSINFTEQGVTFAGKLYQTLEIENGDRVKIISLKASDRSELDIDKIGKIFEDILFNTFPSFDASKDLQDYEWTVLSKQNVNSDASITKEVQKVSVVYQSNESVLFQKNPQSAPNAPFQVISDLQYPEDQRSFPGAFLQLMQLTAPSRPSHHLSHEEPAQNSAALSPEDEHSASSSALLACGTEASSLSHSANSAHSATQTQSQMANSNPATHDEMLSGEAVAHFGLEPASSPSLTSEAPEAQETSASSSNGAIHTAQADAPSISPMSLAASSSQESLRAPYSTSALSQAAQFAPPPQSHQIAFRLRPVSVNPDSSPSSENGVEELSSRRRSRRSRDVVKCNICRKRGFTSCPFSLGANF